MDLKYCTARSWNLYPPDLTSFQLVNDRLDVIQEVLVLLRQLTDVAFELRGKLDLDDVRCAIGHRCLARVLTRVAFHHAALPASRVEISHRQALT